jgi:hypothetical protein
LFSPPFSPFSKFTEVRGNGLILLVYSAILSRGIDNVIADMDFPETTLQGKHGYCNQELVNLLVLGQAHTNVFDDTISVAATPRGTAAHSTVLRGAFQRSSVGYLALFEYYKSCEVGRNLKTPIHPVWVVFSESHYSVLFSLDPACLDPVTKHFDLYYYDQLGNSDELYRLTVDIKDRQQQLPPGQKKKDPPPIEACIQTRWPGAVIDWNGADPLI